MGNTQVFNVAPPNALLQSEDLSSVSRQVTGSPNSTPASA